MRCGSTSFKAPYLSFAFFPVSGNNVVQSRSTAASSFGRAGALGSAPLKVWITSLFFIPGILGAFTVQCQDTSRYDTTGEGLPSWFLVFMLALTSVLTAVVLYLLYRNRRLKEKLVAEKVSAELKALRAQMNPHFIFNALNAVQRFVIKGEKNDARRYLTNYSRVIRTILDQSDKLIVPLAHELEFIDRYIQLEQLRLDHSFNFHVEVDEDLDPYSTYIPGMIIQPALENAIWHGLMPKEEMGTITLQIKADEENVYISVIDNGVGFDVANQPAKEGHTSYGLKLMEERIRLLNVHYRQTITFKVESKKDIGTTVHFCLSRELA